MSAVEVEYYDPADQIAYPGRLLIDNVQVVSSRSETISVGVYKTTVKMVDGSSFVLKGSNSKADLFLAKI